MINIEKFYRYICDYKCGHKEIDLAHNCLLFGAVLASKPEYALELGIGNGYATRAILYAMKYNQTGLLTSVDNWHDWKGREPAHIEELRNLGVNVEAPIDEGDFVRNQLNDSFDFLMSDGSHKHAGEWAEDIFRIMKPNSVMFFHDVNSDRPSLKRYLKLSEEMGLPHFMFSKNSLDNEKCGRGLFVVINKKE